MNFLYRFSKNPQISNSIKTRPVGAELLHAERQMDRHDEGNSRFHSFANAPKNGAMNANIMDGDIFFIK
jgi:hypothetical protein